MREEKKTNRTKDIFRLFSGALIPFAFFFLQFIECLHENAGFFLCAGEYSWIFVYSFKQKKKLLWLSVYNYRILERICLQMYKPINSSHFDRQCKGDVAYLNRFFFLHILLSVHLEILSIFSCSGTEISWFYERRKKKR